MQKTEKNPFKEEAEALGFNDLPIQTIGKQIDEIFKPTKSLVSNSEKHKPFLIDPLKEIGLPPVAMFIKDGEKFIPMLTKGNFSIMTGAAKSRKTFNGSMLLAAAISGEHQDLFKCEPSGMNLLFDTEQSEYKAVQIARRIIKLSGTKGSNFKAYHLRSLSPDERLEVIEDALKSEPNLGFVIIDGIIDLAIDPILQADQAQTVIQKLMTWSEFYNIHICCVLHYNKTVNTLIGHLGSFAHRKADCVIEVVKDKNSGASICSCVDSREVEFNPYSFLIDNNGMPVIIETAAPKKKTAPLNPEMISPEFARKLVEGMEGGLNFTKTLKDLKNIYEMEAEGAIGTNKAKSLLTRLVSLNLLKKEQIKKDVIYSKNDNVGYVG